MLGALDKAALAALGAATPDLQGECVAALAAEDDADLDGARQDWREGQDGEDDAVTGRGLVGHRCRDPVHQHDGVPRFAAALQAPVSMG